MDCTPSEKTGGEDLLWAKVAGFFLGRVDSDILTSQERAIQQTQGHEI